MAIPYWSFPELKCVELFTGLFMLESWTGQGALPYRWRQGNYRRCLCAVASVTCVTDVWSLVQHDGARYGCYASALDRAWTSGVIRCLVHGTAVSVKARKLSSLSILCGVSHLCHRCAKSCGTGWVLLWCHAPGRGVMVYCSNCFCFEHCANWAHTA